MKLILSSSLLLATSSSISAQSSLSSALHPRDLIKDTNFKLASLSRALSLDIHRLPTRSRRNRTRRAQSCEETRSDALEEEFDRLRENYYNEIICDESGNCQWDASPLKDEGIFDVAVAECEDGGGILYLVKTQISCEDGSSHSLIDIPFSCNADCGDGSLFELFFPSSVPAATFLEMTLPRINLTTTCVYDDFSIDVLASEGTDDGTGTDDGEQPPEEEDDDDFDDDFEEVCPPIESAYYDRAFNSVFEASGSYTCEPDDPSDCTIDLTSAFEEGGMDTLSETCTTLGGSLYIISTSIFCDGDPSAPGSNATDGIIEHYKSFPDCFTDCSVEILQMGIVEGGSVDDGCIFQDVDEIYAYDGVVVGEDDAVVVEDDVVGTDDGEQPPEEEDDAFDDDLGVGICPPMDDDVYNDEFNSVFADSGSFTCNPDDFSECTYDFSGAFEEGDGGVDILNESCTSLGGSLYVVKSMSISCSDIELGASLNADYMFLPMCMTDCSVELMQMFFVLGESAGDGCIFLDVGEIYVYGDDNDDTVETGDDTVPVEGDDAPSSDDEVMEDDTPSGDDDVIDVVTKMPKMPKVTKQSKMPKKVKASKMPKKAKAPKMPKVKLPKVPKAPKME